MGQVVLIVNPFGRIVRVPVDHEAHDWARRGVNGYSLPVPDNNEGEGEASASPEPEPEEEPDTGFPIRLGRKRGRPRKVQAEE